MEIKGKLLNGQPFDQKSLAGKVVLVDFWATWCAPCVEEIPNMLEQHKKHHEQGFAIVGVRACLKIQKGPVFAEKAAGRGATREHTRQRSVTEEQRSPAAFSAKTLRAAGLLPAASVGSTVTARCGDAPVSPPWPQPKSLAAGPFSILKQALSVDENRKQLEKSIEQKQIPWLERRISHQARTGCLAPLIGATLERSSPPKSCLQSPLPDVLAESGFMILIRLSANQFLRLSNSQHHSPLSSLKSQSAPCESAGAKISRRSMNRSSGFRLQPARTA